MRRLLDYVSLAPTRHEIAVAGMDREQIVVAGRRVDAFVLKHRAEESSLRLKVLKFVGAGGRAENMTPHPIEHWNGVNAEVWSVNPPGYGNSEGRASLHHIVPTALALYDRAVGKAECQVLLMGTSLGAATAVAVAAQRPVSGLLVRDTPQLRQVIAQRFGWWTLGAANVSARQLPEDLNTLAAANECAAPALFITSGRDRIVPCGIQHQVVKAYAGARKVVHFPHADHGEPPRQADLPNYVEGLGWLRSQLGI